MNRYFKLSARNVTISISLLIVVIVMGWLENWFGMGAFSLSLVLMLRLMNYERIIDLAERDIERKGKIINLLKIRSHEQ
jgi:Ca2+-dependent lipid-binding protein